ncbi:MAG: 30S ribosomal protein S6 [Calditrichaeota bacterium]|nr:30S ribosomal protein S6 [Calditrichota bacterium]
MQHYELMFILDPANEEAEVEVKQKIEGIITGREGEMISFDKLGKKRLAYPIAKRPYGTYFLANLKGNGRIVQALDYFLRLNTTVLRHMIIAFSEKDLGLRQRTEVVLAEEAERMRLGGRPIGTKGDEEVAAETVIETITSGEDSIIAEAEEIVSAEEIDARTPPADIEAAADEVISAAVETSEDDTDENTNTKE